MKVEEVVLVDDQDRALGRMEKMEAHRKGVLHRAFSAFVLNDRGELMLQQRAHEKYHSGGLWTNTCCSHPRPEEQVLVAGERRLTEEMGFTTPLKRLFKFIYRAELDNELTEHELDHVLLGYYNENPIVNPSEVAGFRWVGLEEVSLEMQRHPERFTEWFKICFAPFYEHMKELSAERELD